MMNPERWQQASRILEIALEHHAERRAAYLDEVCANDAELRREVESLLTASAQAGSLLDSPAMAIAAPLFVNNPDKTIPGQSVGRYKIVSALGEGGMGAVYLAHDTKLGRNVALKLLSTHFSTDKDRLRRFEHEACTASTLSHPNICMIYEVGETGDGRHFIAMEYVDGVTLRQHMTETRMKLNEVLDVAMQAASGLAASHEVGVVHRDIKPENIMLRHDGYVKILDFGLAKLTEAKDARPEELNRSNIQTAAGMIMGTVHYMSPEQSRGEEVDARTDIFSLGVVLYEMVAGQLPFEGKDVHRRVIAIQEQEPCSLSSHVEGVPERLEEIVAKTLAKKAGERYQTARDLLIDLGNLKKQVEIYADIERSFTPDKQAVAAIEGKAPAIGTNEAGAVTIATPSSSSLEYIVSGIRQHKRNAMLALATIIVLGTAGFVYYFQFVHSGKKVIDSIAVLPFTHPSNDPNTEFLSDGITEALINSLTELRQLRVVARATAFRYKGQEVDAQSVGRELNVRAVLMGKVRQMGDTLNIQVDLVDATTGAQLWGQEYERKVSDVLSIKQAISREVTEKLRLRLSGGEERQLTKRDTTNAEAYQFYLRGRYFWNKRTVEGLKKAIEQFQQAIDRDPNYALGYVGLADSILLLDEYDYIPSSETVPKARAAADRALQIDDSLAEGHTSLALIYQRLWRWGEAEAEFKRAISLNPNYSTAHHWFAIYLAFRQQFDDALKEIKRAQDLDPLSPVINTTLAEVYLLKNDPDSAIEECKRVIELDPHFPGAHDDLGSAYLKQRRYQEAMTEFQKSIELSGGSEGLSDLGYLYAVTGRRSQALRILKELEEKYEVGRSGLGIAVVYAGLGEKDQAFAWLERDFEQRSGELPFITYGFASEDFRSDPRYADLVRRMGLKP